MCPFRSSVQSVSEVRRTELRVARSFAASSRQLIKDGVVVTKETVRSVLRAMADDDAFLETIMQNLSFSQISLLWMLRTRADWQIQLEQSRAVFRSLRKLKLKSSG